MAENRAIPRRRMLACAAGSAALFSLGASRESAWIEAVQGMAREPSRDLRTRRTIMLDQVTVSDFAAHLGTRFTLEGSPEGISDLELFKAEGLGYRGVPGGEASGRRETFSLRFRGPEGIVLPQGTYTMIHESLGTFALFLVPIGPGRQGGGLRYEAIFG
jgi:hypothetical protein